MSDEVSPSAKLAAAAVDRLIASGLMRADKRDALIVKIAAGTMSGADWKLEVDLATSKGASQ
ncbi:hypothetical protein [Sphingopyxis macrogoltabida]|uniref:Uncharacterized protein n=1 Tax=Sphingopyxis macrogoltabida TaxID=33050 RepID=A0A0N9UKZ6_SPHMC|nr:hypothetical protein [Sphingopyxis macrogoltabida]ALH80110.1 hypothetical protein AN936_06950 [Sphingopyxis macrogoltabida]